MARFSKLMPIRFSRHISILLAAGALTGCSEYLDRTDTLSWQSGNAVQTDKLTQMVDPWPVVSGNRNIAFDGAVMQSAVGRYRTGKVIQPRGISGESGGNNNAAQPAAGPAPLGPTVNSQSAPVK